MIIPELPSWVAPLLFALATFAVFLATFLFPIPGAAESGINRGTRFFLVVLRLAIGWHFLVEGLEKVNNPSWTSEPYLHAATGPFGKYFREIGDQRFLAKLDVGEDKKFPEALDREWERYLDVFEEQFPLDQEQAKKARIKLDQAKARTLKWLTEPHKVDKPSPYLNRPAEMTVAQRVQYYKDLLQQVDEIARDQIAGYGEGAKKKLADAWDEAQKVYASLKKDLATQTADMKKDLNSALPANLRPLSMPAMPPPEFDGTPLAIGDFVVRWGLCVVGVCLIGGLLTRTNCVLGAAFLLLFFLPMMPLPGWPENPRAEGHYLFINKNVIEMLALLALATTRSGRWVGLDGLLQFLRPGRGRRAPAGPTDRTGERSDGSPQLQPVTSTH